MSELATVNGVKASGIAEKRSGFEGLSIDDAFARIVAAAHRTIEDYTEMAAGILYLESLGVEVSMIRSRVGNALTDWLRRIALGRLAPEALYRWHDLPSAIRIVSKLPMQDQIRLANGGKVQVLVEAAESGLTSREATVDEIVESRIAAQVFDGDRIRSPAEQALIVDRKRRQKAREAAVEKIGSFIVDRERGGAVFHGKRGSFIDARYFREIIKALS